MKLQRMMREMLNQKMWYFLREIQIFKQLVNFYTKNYKTPIIKTQLYQKQLKISLQNHRSKSKSDKM